MMVFYLKETVKNWFVNNYTRALFWPILALLPCFRANKNFQKANLSSIALVLYPHAKAYYKNCGFWVYFNPFCCNFWKIRISHKNKIVSFIDEFCQNLCQISTTRINCEWFQEKGLKDERMERGTGIISEDFWLEQWFTFLRKTCHRRTNETENWHYFRELSATAGAQ